MESVRSLAAKLQGEERGNAKALAFLRAAWRMVHPARFDALPYEFDTSKELVVAVERSGEPKLDTPEWWASLGTDGAALAGMSPETVVSVYVNQDQRVANLQGQWVRDWKVTDRQTRRSSSFDGERRRALLGEVSARRASYEWIQSPNGRRPYLRIAMFNGLDVNVVGLMLLVDLIDDKGRAVASARLRHDPTFAIQPKVEAILTIDLGPNSPLANPIFQDVATRLRVGIRVENVVNAKGDMLVPRIAMDEAASTRRAAMIASLETRLRGARDNLLVFRQLFGENAS